MDHHYPKKWFIVPHDEYPASTTLPLGQLVGGVSEISHPLNRKTRLNPPFTDISETVQTNFESLLTRSHHFHGHIDAAMPFGVVDAGAGGGGGTKRGFEGSLTADVVLTQLLRPSDDYASRSFEMARSEKEMANHLKQLMPWNRKVFMVTGRKIGCSISVHRHETSSLDEKIKTSFNFQSAVNLGANLSMDWKDGLSMKGFTAEPCVFAVQLRRIDYHKKSNEATTKDFVKGAVFEREVSGPGASGRASREEEDLRVSAYIADGITSEEPRADMYDYDTVPFRSTEGKDEAFLLALEEELEADQAL